MQADKTSFVQLAALWLVVFAPPLLHAQSIGEQLNSGRIDLLRAQADNVQRLATLNTFVGRTDLNSDLMGLPRSTLDRPPESRRVIEASRILSTASDSRVLMFNENHYEPQARVFVASLLPALRRAGFTHIGFEAFQPSNAADAYLPFNGHYTVEPLFSGLIRRAEALGFVVFGYEATHFADQNASMEKAIEVRERSQAENLAAAIDSFPGSAKVVIFAGWSHIAEKALNDGLGQGKTMWMAARFSEATRIDPFTVDLTTCAYEVSTSGHRDGLVYVRDDGSSSVAGPYAGAVDAQVCLPIPGRSHPSPPSFYRSTLGKQVRIPRSLQSRSAQVLVQAFEAGRPEKDIAYDRVLVRPGERLHLYLPPGSYELLSTLEDGTLVGRAPLIVSK